VVYIPPVLTSQLTVPCKSVAQQPHVLGIIQASRQNVRLQHCPEHHNSSLAWPSGLHAEDAHAGLYLYWRLTYYVVVGVSEDAVVRPDSHEAGIIWRSHLESTDCRLRALGGSLIEWLPLDACQQLWAGLTSKHMSFAIV
jgi:hypothetical protein